MAGEFFEHDDEEDDEERRVVPDGGIVRVPALLMDHRRAEAIIRDALDGDDDDDGGDNVIRDAAGRPAGHRPGFLFGPPTPYDDAAARARQRYIARLTNAWRRPGERAAPKAAPPLGDNLRDARRLADEAWARKQERTQNAWRRK
jgi:hypothetical protein